MATATVGLRCWGEDTYHLGLLMKLRLARGPVLVPLALLLSSGEAKAWVIQRPSKEIPENIAKVVALDEGGALVLGYNGHYHEEDVLVRIGPAGDPTTVTHPPAGTLLDMAVRGPEVWVLGTETILYRNGQEEWSSLPLPDDVVCTEGRYVRGGGGHSLSDVRESNVVAIDRMRCAVTCADTHAVPLSTIALVVGADTGVEARFMFKDLALGLLVADGAGGFWTYVDSREGPEAKSLGILGYARYHQGHWVIWSSGAVDPGGFDQKHRREMADRAYFASEDGAGGYWLIHDGGRRTHARSGGAHSVSLPPFGDPGPAAYDRNTGTLLSFANGSRYLDAGDLGDLLHVGPDETILSQETVPIWPLGQKMRIGEYMAVESLSVVRSEIWLAASSFVERRKNTERTVYWSPKVAAFHEEESHRAEWAAGIIAALLCSAVGILRGARIHRERHRAMACQTLSGLLVGATPLLIFYDDIGLFVRGGLLGCLEGSVSFVFYTGPAIAAAVLGGLATFVVGEWIRRSKRTGAALLGAVAGAVGGTLFTAILFMLVLINFNIPNGVSAGMNLGLVASGATIAYQWASGGPR
jgi:hypothetical protein